MNVDDIIFEVPEFLKEERLDMAYRAWKDPENALSIRGLATKFKVI
jgi:hypothetical protein